MKEAIFLEKQKFKGTVVTFVWILLICLFTLIVYGIIRQSVFNMPFGTRPVSTFILILIAFFILIFAGLFRFATLVVQINSDSISYRWAPFGKTSNVIKTENIAFVELIKFKFSGLGYRISNRYGIMHVANGNTGILISLKNKKKYLLGVHDVSRASQALSKVLPKEQLQISIS